MIFFKIILLLIKNNELPLINANKRYQKRKKVNFIRLYKENFGVSMSKFKWNQDNAKKTKLFNIPSIQWTTKPIFICTSCRQTVNKNFNFFFGLNETKRFYKVVRKINFSLRAKIWKIRWLFFFKNYFEFSN